MKLPACDICAQPVTIDDGSIWVSSNLISMRQDAVRAWSEANPSLAHDMATLMTIPEKVEWRWGHRNCSDPDGDDYSFAAKRFDSVDRALGWSLHLFSKTWIHDTNWELFVRRLHDVPRT